MNATILSDTQVMHRADHRGVVIGRQQVIMVDGAKYRVDFWYQWETGRLHHVDSVAI